jgi:hypothetical protein
MCEREKVVFKGVEEHVDRMRKARACVASIALVPM